MRRIVFNPNRDAVAAMLVMGIAALLAIATSAVSARPGNTPTARAPTPTPTAPASPTVTSEGGLILRSSEGEVATTIPAMRLGTDIVANVSGQIARVTVTQAFRNTSNQWMEATYLYPLPEEGAVDTLSMVVGNRIFRGNIKPREEARQIYEEARDNGQKAGLVEQARPNMFQNSIANVGPGETVLIQIEYQAPIRFVAGEYALRMPLVVGPRYTPGGGAQNGKSLSRAARLAGDTNVTAPVADPSMVARAGGGLNPVSITVNLDPGFSIAEITSAYHEVNVGGIGEGQDNTRTVTLAEGAVPADRDFELSWRPSGSIPSGGLWRERHGELDYVMAVITPPSLERLGEAPHEPMAREMIFVIDNSGSMAGQSMPAARRSLLYALSTLRPQDRFNIIRFDDTMDQLFENAVPADARNIDEATRFTNRLDAEGGTEMLPALRAALAGGATSEEGHVRQVIFLTDGSLSNESEMMEEIARNRGDSRVFMVGIGSAPNSYLMRRMAEAGRGTFTHVGISDEAENEMQSLLDRLAAPVATDLTACVEGGNIDFAPRDLPDLYAGEPLVLLGRTRHLAGTLTISGNLDGRRWSETLDLTEAAPSEAVAKLWANRRIADIEAERWSGEMSYELADMAIEELGMDFHLVTSRTSLVAVDETPTRPEGARLLREELPLLLPAGWEFDALFPAASAIQPAGDPTGEAERNQRLRLPNTSTGYALTCQIGLALLLAGLMGLAWWRRERWSRMDVASRLRMRST